MYCEKKTVEQMKKDCETATKMAINELQHQLKTLPQENSLEVEISSESLSYDASYDDNLAYNKFKFNDSSDDDSVQEEIVLRKSAGVKQKHHKNKENNMIFMFSKYESAQKKNRLYKTKLIKLENKLMKLEERDHFKNLELSNSKIKINELLEKNKQLEFNLKSSKTDLVLSSIIFITAYIVTFIAVGSF